MLDGSFVNSSKDWLVEQFKGLPDEVIILTPSEWAEKTRYLPPQVTPLPGNYSFDINPYLREPLDCFSLYSPIRKVSVMKGVQVGATVGILENVIGYAIDHIKNAPVMFVTADAELAKLRLESNIIPMIDHSGLEHLIKSTDEKNKRKSGQTNKKIEWVGGGFLVPFGAQNANKLRSLSIQILAKDEIDAWPDKVGKDGDPDTVVDNRTVAFESSRKILNISTPLIEQTSKIHRNYENGDKRKYMVPCKHCDELQELVPFIGAVNKEDGTTYGLDFERDDKGNLIEGSVKYLCKHCQGAMTNDDKSWMYREGGKYCKWVPTATPTHSQHRSYHISSLYSPVGMESWESIVRKWLECWDIDNSRPKDIVKQQEFYNNCLGLPFKAYGEALSFYKVQRYRRSAYHSGEIPNRLAVKETGSKVLFLTLAVDVHKERLDVQVIGHCRGNRFYSIEWFKFEGDCSNIDSEPWEKVKELIFKEYISDDGFKYHIQITLIDSRYLTDVVNRFCEQFAIGVYPIRGTEFSLKSAKIREFSEFTSKGGNQGYSLTTTFYKDRMSSNLRREWDGLGEQPDGYANFPQDYTDQFFKELTNERKVEKTNKTTGQIDGYTWVGQNVHAWDTTIYNAAAHDLIALNICILNLKIEHIDRKAFWDLCEQGLFFSK